jgi:hypothetical protein
MARNDNGAYDDAPQHFCRHAGSLPMDDFTQMIKLLESARQLANMNQLPMLAYLVEMAKAETRGHRFTLRERRRGQDKSEKVQAAE